MQSDINSFFQGVGVRDRVAKLCVLTSVNDYSRMYEFPVVHRHSTMNLLKMSISLILTHDCRSVHFDEFPICSVCFPWCRHYICECCV